MPQPAAGRSRLPRLLLLPEAPPQRQSLSWLSKCQWSRARSNARRASHSLRGTHLGGAPSGSTPSGRRHLVCAHTTSAPRSARRTRAPRSATTASATTVPSSVCASSTPASRQGARKSPASQGSGSTQTPLPFLWQAGTGRPLAPRRTHTVAERCSFEKCDMCRNADLSSSTFFSTVSNSAPGVSSRTSGGGRAHQSRTRPNNRLSFVKKKNKQ